METKLLEQQIRQSIKNNNLFELKHLLESDPSQVNATYVFGNWLHTAISLDASIEIIQCLVEAGVDVNQRAGILGGNPLNLAASEGRVDVVNYLLKCDAEIDISEPERNPLFSAIYGGHKDVVNLLLSQGIDVTVRYSGENMNDMDAEAFARERGQTEIAQIISTLHHKS